MKNAKTARCPWCSRDGVPLTKKGGLKPHVNPGGLPCRIGVRLGEDTRTPKRRWKGTVNRNANRRGWTG